LKNVITALSLGFELSTNSPKGLSADIRRLQQKEIGGEPLEIRQSLAAGKGR
jgi:hypothetical protein